jgi:hypothetical protein
MLHGGQQDAVGMIQCRVCHQTTLSRFSTSQIRDIEDASVYVIPGLK